MLSLFKQIRQRLLVENKISRYLAYAIGEIFLVVIGILIAIQINNWNEFRKDRVREQQILHDIEHALLSDIENEFNPHIERFSTDYNNINTLIRHLDNDLPYNDSLSSKFRSLMQSKSFKWELTAYRNLENEGITLITDERIKQGILHIYNMLYPELEDQIGNFSDNLIEFYRPEMRAKFIIHYDTTSRSNFTPINYEALKNDIIFKNTLHTARLNFQSIQNSLVEKKKIVETTIDEISEKVSEN